MPIQGLSFCFDLFFPIEQARPVLQRIGKLGGEASEHRTELLLRGEVITMPFSSWYGERRIQLKPGSKARLYAYLRFPADDALRTYFRQRSTQKHAERVGEAPDTLFTRLIVLVGKRYVGLRFLAPSALTNKLFVESREIRGWFSRLLKRHKGVLGILDVGQGQSYLLPDLQTCIQAPDARDYYDENCLSLDADRWVEDLLRLEPQNTQILLTSLPEGKAGAIAQRADLRGIDLRNACLRDAELRGIDLSYANLSGADLSGADLTDARLQFANLSAANLSETRLERANLKHARLCKSLLMEANLIDADLDYADLKSADLQRARLGDCLQGSARLRGANLKKVNLTDASLIRVDLCYANLAGANFHGADLEDATLSFANLEGAILHSVSLYSASIHHANLSNANLRDASLFGHGSLEHSDLTNADLGSANLRQASLYGAVIYNTNFERARYDFQTIWPDEVMPVDEWPKLREPHPDTILESTSFSITGGEGSLVLVGFGPTEFSTADYVAIPMIHSPEDIDETVKCACLRFEDFVDVLGAKIAKLEPRRWYVPPEVNMEELGHMAHELTPHPFGEGGYLPPGVNPQELGLSSDALVPIDVRYFVSGINLRDPQDLALYKQLLNRTVEPSPFSYNLCDLYGWGGDAVRQMRIWFDQ